MITNKRSDKHRLKETSTSEELVLPHRRDINDLEYFVGVPALLCMATGNGEQTISQNLPILKHMVVYQFYFFEILKIL